MKTAGLGSIAAAGPRRMPTRRGWRFLTTLFERADAFLLGRKTWEIWEPYWPKHDAGDPVSHGINVLPKYVPSTTLKDPTWQNTHVIDGDVEAAVRELKAQARPRAPGPRQRRAPPVAARARPRRRAQPAGLSRDRRRRAPAVPGEGPEPRPRADRVLVDEIRSDVPDLSTGRPREVRERGAGLSLGAAVVWRVPSARAEYDREGDPVRVR